MGNCARCKREFGIGCYEGKSLFMASGRQFNGLLYCQKCLDDIEKALFILPHAVLHWAETPGNHGGNPYRHDFVKLAQTIIGDEQ